MPLLDNLMSLVSPQLLGSMAGKLGESPDAVQKGLQGGIAAVMGALGNKTGDSSFLQQILGMVTSKANDPAILSDLGGLLSGNIPQALKDLAGQLLSSVLGSQSQQSQVSNLIGQASGLKGSSASSILGMAAPMVLGMLGKQAASGGGLNASSLGSMLSAELPSLGKFMPAGLGSLIGGVNLPKMPAAPEAPSGGGGGWVLPALIGLLLLGGLIWWLKSSARVVPAHAPR